MEPSLARDSPQYLALRVFIQGSAHLFEQTRVRIGHQDLRIMAQPEPQTRGLPAPFVIVRVARRSKKWNPLSRVTRHNTSLCESSFKAVLTFSSRPESESAIKIYVSWRSRSRKREACRRRS